MKNLNAYITMVGLFLCSYCLLANENNSNEITGPEHGEATCASISALKIYDQGTDAPVAGISELTDGVTIDLAQLPANYYIVAELSSDIGSVELIVDAVGQSCENVAPYTYPNGAQDLSGGWNAGAGCYTLITRLYLNSGCSGTLCEEQTIDFCIEDVCANLTVDAGSDVTICDTESITLSANVSGTSECDCCVRTVSNTNHCSNSNNYVLWLDGVHYTGNNDLVWEECGDGTARLTGSATYSGTTYDIDIIYSGYADTPPQGSPKNNNCGSTDATGWFYYSTMTGTLTNGSTVYNLSRRGPAFQVGNGANITTTGYGGSGWFDAVDGGTNLIGDINIMLSETCNSDCTPGTIDGMDYLGSYGDSHYYYKSSGDMSYLNAKSYVESRGGHLPKIEDSSENSWLASQISSSIWLSYSDDASEGNWIWYDGSSGSYTNWSSGEPTNNAGEDFTRMKTDGMWTDREETNLYGVILEIECSSVPISNEVTYLWTPGNYTTPSITVSPASNTSYTVEVTSCDGCTATDNVTVTVGGGLVCPADVTIDCEQSSHPSNTGMPSLTCDPNAIFTYEDSDSGTCPIVKTRTWTASVTRIVSNPCVPEHLASWNFANANAKCSNGIEPLDGSGLAASFTNTSFCNNLTISNVTNNDGSSCVKGVFGSAESAICVSATSESYFVDNDDDAITFTVDFGINDEGTISALSFYEKVQPNNENFGHVDYAQKFGFRVLKDGIEIYQNDNNNTSLNTWTQHSFDFSGNTDFEYTGPVTFTFEILGYDPTNNGHNKRVWEFDELIVEGCCGMEIVNEVQEFTCTQTITINDNQNPTLTNVPADITVECASQVPAVPTDVVADDNCSFTTDFQETITGNQACNDYTVTRVWTVTDNCSNQVSGTQVITVQNNGPTITCPPDMSISDINSFVPGDPTVVTICGLNATVSGSGPVLVSGNACNGATYEYTYTATDDCGDTASCVQTITTPASSLSCVASGTDTSCGLSNGSASVTASNGSGSYSYNWSNGAITQSVSGLSSGTYTVTVTDNSGGCTSSCSVIISSSSTLSCVASGTDTSCGLLNGSASVAVSNGSGSYTYNWSNGANTQSISGLSSGTYTVTVTDNSGGCTSSCSVVIASSNALSCSVNGTDTSCGLSDGTASVTVSNGSGSYTYSWSNGGNSQSISGLSSGSYSVTVTDTNSGCATSCSVIIASSNTLSCNLNGTDTSCGLDNGSASVSVNNGSGTYTYSWSNGANTQTISGLSSGTYSVTVTDNNSGCVTSCSVTVASSNVLTCSVSGTDSTCGNPNGTATAFGSDGSGNYSYAWNNGATSQTLSGLSSGTFSVTVTDNNSGCTAFCDVTINCLECQEPVMATQCTPPTSGYDYDVNIMGFQLWHHVIGMAADNVTGQIRITGDGTLMVPNSNLILNSSNAIVYIDGPELIVNNGNIQLDASGARFIMQNGVLRTYGNVQQSPGTFVCITDSEMEIGDEEVNGQFQTTGNNSTSANFQNDGGYRYLKDVCFNVTHNFDLSSSGTGTGVSGVDVLINVCAEIGDRGLNNATPTDFGVADGDDSGDFHSSNRTYIFYSDIALANGNFQNNAGHMTICDSDIKVNKTGNFQNNNGPSTLDGQNVCIAAEDEISNEDVWTATISSWYSDKQNSLIGISGPPESLEADILAECFAECCIPPVMIDCFIAGVDGTCGDPNGSATVTVSGGSGDYSYCWSTEEDTQTISGLAAGTYSVTVVDNQFDAVTACSIVILDVGEIICSISGTDTSCGLNNGAASVNLTGGSGSFSYSWSNGANTQTISGLSSGSYSVTVTDTNSGCTTSCSVTIASSNPVSCTVSGNDAVCGQADGSASVIVSGGSGNYSYSWSNGANTQSVSNLAEGTYTVTVTDNTSGCTTSCNVTIGCCLSITTLRIYDQSTDAPAANIPALTNGLNINLSDLPDSYYIVAETNGTGGSVEIIVNGMAQNCENSSPFTYPNDAETDDGGWNDGVGCYTVVARSYEQSDCGGQQCSDLTLNFCIDQDCVDFSVDAGLDETICAGESVTLSAEITGSTECDCCVRTVSDTYHCNSSAVYVLWLDGVHYTGNNDLSWEECGDGTAHLTGSATYNGVTYHIDITYSGYSTTTPQGSPKNNNCGSTNTTGWFYYTEMSGTLSSGSTVYTLTQRGPAFQVGDGANVTTTGYGGSGWFDADDGNTSIVGDINIMLSQDCSSSSDCTAQTISGMDYLGTYGNSHYYMKNSGDMQYWNAKSYVESRGGYLPKIETPGENAWLASQISGSIWLSLSDEVQEGTWIWHDGEEALYTNWKSGEPSNNSGEDFARMMPDGYWTDRPDTKYYWVVMEVECGSQGQGGINDDVSYLWTPGNFTTPTITVSPNVTTTYTVQVTGCDGCVASDNVTVTVNGEFECPIDVTIDCDESDHPDFTGEPTITCDPNAIVTYVDSDSGTCPIIRTRTWTASIFQYTETPCIPEQLAHWDFSNANTKCSNGIQPLDGSGLAASSTNNSFCSNLSISNVTNNDGSSCVKGVFGSAESAICVSTSPENYFKDADDDAITFTVSFGAGDEGRLSGLSFYEKVQPNNENFGYVDYAQKFGFRVLKDGLEIYQNDNNLTSLNAWTQHSYDFTGNTDFDYTGPVVFTIEILGYDPTNNGHNMDVWEFDELHIEGCCGTTVENEVQTFTCTQTITINDNVPPTLTNVPANITIECDADIPPVPTDVIADDNCEFTTDFQETTTGQANCNGYVVTRTWTVTDGCNHTVSQSQQITIQHAEPSITCPSNVTISDINNFVPGTATVTTVCGLSSTITGAGPNYVSGDVCGGAIYEYVYTVTDDCGDTDSCTQTITVPGTDIACTISGTDTTCGQPNGSAIINPTGGSGNYTYDWSTGAKAQSLGGLVPGTYFATVTDVNTACTTICSVSIGGSNAISCSINGTDTTCGLSNGTASVNTFDGSGNYSYTWSHGPSSQILTDLASGTYSVTVTDNNTACTTTCNVTIGAST